MGHVKNTLFAIAFFVFSMSANASFLIEPHLGYNISGSGTTSNVVYDYSNPEFGVRFGGQYLGLMAGLDYTLSSYTWKQTPGGNDEFNRSELGVFVGYNLPILLRFWGTYYFINTAKDTNNGGRTSVGAKYEGSTTELGVGFTPLPFLSLNLMYRNINIDTKPSNITSADISNSEFVLGVSLPLTLL
jgi:hypothetical protein